MKTNTLFECEHCGYKSEDADEIIECESQCKSLLDTLKVRVPLNTFVEHQDSNYFGKRGEVHYVLRYTPKGRSRYNIETAAIKIQDVVYQCSTLAADNLSDIEYRLDKYKQLSHDDVVSIILDKINERKW
jgi:hypothetical protein